MKVSRVWEDYLQEGDINPTTLPTDFQILYLSKIIDNQ